MLAVSDERALVMLEFWERRGLVEAVEGLTRTAPVVPGRSAPIDSVERELSDYFAGRRGEFATPLALAGSAFQLRVWDELRRIAPGRTLSYLGLAQRLGDPRAVRAVAQANGANRLAVVVPCHRAIAADGGLTGYAAGVERKRWLLEHERARFGDSAGRLF